MASSNEVELKHRDHGLGPWIVTVSLEEVRGRVECVGLAFRSSRASNPEPISAAQFRAIRPATMATLAKRKIADHSVGTKARPDLINKARHKLDARDSSLGGAPGRGPEHFARVASEYARAWSEGLHPTQAVAEWGSVSRSAAAKWVYRSRKLGLLPATTKGKPSGRLG